MKEYTLSGGSILKNIYFWSAAWLCLAVSYVLSIQYNFYSKEWNSAIYTMQLAADACIGLFGYLSYRSRINSIERKFYLLIFLSLIPGLFANEVYNILINFIGIKNITSNINKYWAIAYTVFLLIQIFSWSYLIHNKKENSAIKNWLTTLSYIQPIIIILVSLAAIILFRNNIFSKIGSTGMINSTLEACLFVLLSISLSKTKNDSLAYLEVGFLLLIAFNLAHRFGYTAGHHVKAFDVLWMISLVIIIFGLVSSWKNKAEKIEFFESSSIHSITSAIFVTFATFLLILFILIDFVFSSIKVNGVGATNILPQNIPTILIFSYSLTLLSSRVAAHYFSKPLAMVLKRIDSVYENEANANKIMGEKINIAEIDKLDKFILKIITQLQAANRVKSDFLMNMSHDFRTPASGISQMSRIVYKNTTDPVLKNQLKLVVDSSEQLVNLLDGVLDYSKLDNTEIQSNVEKFNVEELVNELMLFVSAKATEKGLSIGCEFSETPINYVGDRLMMHRIMLNLISNAIKFTHVGGVVMLVSKEVRDDHLWLVIKVKDTGIGIDEKYHHAIFEPFYRITSAKGDKHSGIGLGLSNISTMIKKIEGKIFVDSSLGKGAIFTVYFPS